MNDSLDACAPLTVSLPADAPPPTDSPPASAPPATGLPAVAPRCPEPPAVSSTVRSVGGLMSLGWFLPAPVQRNFEWDQRNAIQLLNDIDKALSRLPEPDERIAPDEHEPAAEAIDAADGDVGETAADTAAAGAGEPTGTESLDDKATQPEAAEDPPAEDLPAHYFIGNVILCPTGGRRYEVYDGLQRLTTLTILIAVLRDQIEDAAVRGGLDALIAEDERYRLRLYGRDITLAEHVQGLGATARKLDNRAYYEIGRRILAVKNALSERIAQWDEVRRVRYARFLLSSVLISVLEVPDQRLARQMFVSTNLYGKRLEPLDLLKGQIADAISEAGSPEAVARFTRDWEAAKQVSGKAFEELVKAVDAIERTDIQDKAWPTQLAAHLATAYPGTALEDFVRRLIDYAGSWRDCKRVLRHAGPTEIERSFWRLHVFWWPEWHALALRWWQQVERARQQRQSGNDEERLEARRILRQLQSRFDRLHRRCMAMTLAQLDEADRQRIFIRALQQDKAGRDVFQGALEIYAKQRRRIDRTLRSQIHRPDIWAPLMQWIEIGRWRDDLPELMLEVNTEHVRPRRPDLSNGPVADESEYNEGCFSIGNLAIISAKENPGLTNREFAQKLPVLRRQARLYDTMRSVVYDDAGTERSQWTNVEIAGRAEKLRDQVWKQMMLKAPRR